MIWRKSVKVSRRQVNREEVKQLVSDLDIDVFFETSAKENIMVEETFVKAALILTREAQLLNRKVDKRV